MTNYYWLLEEFKNDEPQSQYVPDLRGSIAFELTSNVYKALRFGSSEAASSAIGPNIYCGTKCIKPVQHGFEEAQP